MTDVNSNLYQMIDKSAAEQAGDLIAMRHHIHLNPELSNREIKTSAFVAEKLRSYGLDEVRTGIAGYGVVGVLRGGLPGDRMIALRADMDALPVRETSGVDFASTVIDKEYPGGPFPVGHVCGHDCHVATVLATVRILSEMRAQLPGSAVFIFQPAEEGAPIEEEGGARAMLKSGALDDLKPTMAFGMHVGPMPRGMIAYRRANFFAASCLVKIVVKGLGTHGSTPWLGKDPMPAAATIINASAHLYRQVPAYDPVTISFGHVEDHGRFNTIGDSVTLWGTIRCLVNSDMLAVQNQLRILAENTAESFGCTAVVEFLQDIPPVDNTPAWINGTLPTLRRAIGAERVVEIPPTLGYDDVSEFINAYGGVYMFYGVQDATIVDNQLVPIKGGRGIFPNHNSSFYADDEALVDSVRIHAYVAVDHLTGVLSEMAG